MRLVGTLLPSAFGGGPPRPLPASVYLSVQQYSAWEKTVIDELAWAQSFLLPLSQPPWHRPQRLQPALAGFRPRLPEGEGLSGT